MHLLHGRSRVAPQKSVQEACKTMLGHLSLPKNLLRTYNITGLSVYVNFGASQCITTNLSLLTSLLTNEKGMGIFNSEGKSPFAMMVKEANFELCFRLTHNPGLRLV